MAKQTVEFLHHHGDHVPGETASLDADEADRLIRSKRAKPAKAEAAPKTSK